MAEVVKQSHEGVTRSGRSLCLIWISQYEWATRSSWSRYSFCTLSCCGQRRTYSLCSSLEIFAGKGSARFRYEYALSAQACVGLLLIGLYLVVRSLAVLCGDRT